MQIKTGFVLLSTLALMACDKDTYTLYRDGAKITGAEELSPGIIDKMHRLRIHIATFDASDGAAYNQENCELAKSLFQSQPGITSKFWCEKGVFRK